MKMHWFITILLILYLTTFAHAETITVTASKANIRSGPGTGYKIIDVAKKGETLDSTGRRKGWIKVRLKGDKEGWVAEKLIRIAPVQTLRLKVAKENLRQTPRGQKIGEVLKNTKLKVIKTEGRWVKVEIVGWIWRDSTTAKGMEIQRTSQESGKRITKIKGGFSYKNVKLTKSMGMVKVLGEMSNDSGKNFKAASFIITFYDQKGQLLETGDFLINDFSKGQIKPFSAYIENLIFESIHQYQIDFDFGI